MNPLGNGNLSNQNVGIPPQLRQNIQQVKGMMGMFRGNPSQMLQQNPMFNQVLQMCKGQNPQSVFIEMCKSRGLDPNAIINELQN